MFQCRPLLWSNVEYELQLEGVHYEINGNLPDYSCFCPVRSMNNDVWTYYSIVTVHNNLFFCDFVVGKNLILL